MLFLPTILWVRWPKLGESECPSREQAREQRNKDGAGLQTHASHIGLGLRSQSHNPHQLPQHPLSTLGHWGHLLCVEGPESNLSYDLPLRKSIDLSEVKTVPRRGLRVYLHRQGACLLTWHSAFHTWLPGDFESPRTTFFHSARITAHSLIKGYYTLHCTPAKNLE